MLFNIALLPEEPQLAQSLSDYAQSSFATAATGYLLGPDALPHITLCQFLATSEDAALQIFRSWQTPHHMPVYLTHFYLAPGIDEHSGMVWAGFSIRPDAGLLNLQQSCRMHIEERGCASLTGNPYSPHLTLARLSGWPTAPIRLPENIPFLQPITCRAALGLSSEEGMFLRRI